MNLKIFFAFLCKSLLVISPDSNFSLTLSFSGFNSELDTHIYISFCAATIGALFSLLDFSPSILASAHQSVIIIPSNPHSSLRIFVHKS